MRSEDELEPGGHRHRFAVACSGTKTPAIAHRGEQLALPSGIGRFHNAEIGGNSFWSNIERHCHGCIFLGVHRWRKFHFDKNGARCKGRWLEDHADHVPIPQSPPRTKEHFLIHLHRHRRPRFCTRFELPGTYVFNGAFVQAQAERPNDLNIARLSIGAHHQREQHTAFEFRQARFFTVSRGRFGNYERRNNSRSQLKRRRLSGSGEAR